MVFHKLPIPNRFLFRIEMQCRYRENLDEMNDLPPEFDFPDFETLEQSDSSSSGPFSSKNGKNFRVRGAWNEKGIAFQFFISGKTRTLWCNPNRPDESDRIELWLDTRNVHNVHRATRYCHRLVCLPTGDGEDGEKPFATMLPINRTKQMPNEIPNGAMKIASKVQRNCCSVLLYLSADALTGYDPSEFQDLGIAWSLIDRDFPQTTLTAGTPFPFTEDPSLWYSIHLLKKTEEN